MNNDNAIGQQDWNRLHRQMMWLRAGLIFCLVLIAAMAYVLFVENSRVLRTHGLVIVDAQGRDRILIGAPTPTSADRTRKDAAANSIVFLGRGGADRLVIGQSPEPMIAGKIEKRIGNNDDYGLILYDSKGNERGGMSFLSAGRAVVALDRALPAEDAVGLMVDDKTDFAGLVGNYAKRGDFAYELGTTNDALSVSVRDQAGKLRAHLKVAGPDKPEWQLYDAASAPKADTQ